MDLTLVELLPTPNRFPRTRGDGPLDDSASGNRMLFPPHARGWTQHRCRFAPVEVVSPARAGMDPHSDLDTGCDPGFPRTRGDGPGQTEAAVGDQLFPPHARGWTHIGHLRILIDSVSPARAGMDRSNVQSPVCGRRFPRTRGDGPYLLVLRIEFVKFPPHARGWTPCNPADCWRGGVSPARAGMDPSFPNSHQCRRRFPRTRGDGPHTSAKVPYGFAFPPHARGWTRS